MENLNLLVRTEFVRTEVGFHIAKLFYHIHELLKFHIVHQLTSSI